VTDSKNQSRQALERRFVESSADAQAWSGTAAVRHRDGRRLDVDMHTYPSLDGEGKANGFVMAVASDQQGNGYNQRMLEWSFTQASVAMSTFDNELRYQRVNDITYDVMGNGQTRLHGQRYEDTVPDDAVGQEFLRHLRQVARTGTPTRYDSYTGERAWNVEMWPVKDPSDRVRGVGIAAFDSSEQLWARQRVALVNYPSLKRRACTTGITGCDAAFASSPMPGFRGGGGGG
jgi:hypothetical protein